ncbi:hypothetical protein AWV80_03395 [Cupriavidus sp. UYMU48A]|nr:hypothetical protein AWV80_03395 [Cupriavidus sp. UYMU48A]
MILRKLRRFYVLVLVSLLNDFAASASQREQCRRKRIIQTGLDKVREIIKGNASVKQEMLIRQLNPVIRGWACAIVISWQRQPSH